MLSDFHVHGICLSLSCQLKQHLAWSERDHSCNRSLASSGPPATSQQQIPVLWLTSTRLPHHIGVLPLTSISEGGPLSGMRNGHMARLSRALDRIHYVRTSKMVPNISLIRNNRSHYRRSPHIHACYVRIIATLPQLGRHRFRQFVQTVS